MSNTAEVIKKNVNLSDAPDIMLPHDVAELLGLHVKTVRIYIKAGKLRAAKLGKCYRIRKEWVIDFLDKSSEFNTQMDIFDKGLAMISMQGENNYDDMEGGDNNENQGSIR